MDIQLRLATIEDITVLRELIQVAVRKLSEGYYTPSQVESALQYVFGVDTQLIEDGTYILAEIDGEIVGAGGWSKRKTLYGGDQMKAEADPLLDPATEAARIRAFYTNPNFARRGIGRRLMQACENAAREAGFRRMELGSTLPGEPLYSAMGFQVVQWTEIPMPDGQSLPIALMDKTIE